MKKDIALMIPDLRIEVTPAVEDAFYMLRDIDTTDLDMRTASEEDWHTKELLEQYEKDLATQDAIGERFMTIYPPHERNKAVVTALKMIENIEKYGIACAEWAKD